MPCAQTYIAVHERQRVEGGSALYDVSSQRLGFYSINLLIAIIAPRL